MLQRVWQAWRQRRRQAHLQAVLRRRAIDEPLWLKTLNALPFIASMSAPDLAHLRLLTSLFLENKEFSGAGGLQVTDAHAVMVAVQACLPILHMAAPERPDLALAWYDSFVGIVLYPGQVRAQRDWVDENGIAHSGSEELSGEMQAGGPLMLAWSDVQTAGESAGAAYNVVIHEFIHVIDLRDGLADGCPPLAPVLRRQWLEVMQAEYVRFCEYLETWQRFGSLQTDMHAPLLDAYGSTAVSEFFPVAAEAYFTQRQRFALEHPALLQKFDAFFRLQRFSERVSFETIMTTV